MTNRQYPVTICGFMASGKTATAKALSQIMQTPWVDVDAEIERSYGQRITTMFKERGEVYFRSVEREVVNELLTSTYRIISLGGGALQDKEFVHRIKKNSYLVFIKPTFELIYGRLIRSTHRPLLMKELAQAEDHEVVKNRLKSLYLSRLPLYELAHIIIDVQESWSAHYVALQILEKLTHDTDA